MSWLPSFLATFVEFVEALTIVLAVGTTRGWTPALSGAISGVAVLSAVVMFFGSALQQVPLPLIQLTIGILLLLFGVRWLRKAILRAAGVLPLHDEAKIFAEQTRVLKTGQSIAFMTAFNAVLLEGLEVVFVVVGAGSAANAFKPAIVGAAIAGTLVLILGLVIHRPLSRIPENTLKFTVGVLLSAFGTFWVGEGLRYPWPGEDLAVLWLVAGFFTISVLLIFVAKKSRKGVESSIDRNNSTR
jgi:uncharacterized membrane protein